MTDERMLFQFFRCVNERDVSQLSGLLTQDAQFFFPKTQPLLGREMIVKFFRILFRQYPELSFEIQRTIFQGEKAAVHWTNSGKNRKGGHYENEGVTVLEMERGKIRFISDFFKDTEKF